MFSNVAKSTWRLPFCSAPIFLLWISETLPYSFDGCVESVRIRSYSAPYFPAFGLNTERYGVFSPNAGKYGPQ